MNNKNLFALSNILLFLVFINSGCFTGITIGNNRIHWTCDSVTSMGWSDENKITTNFIASNVNRTKFKNKHFTTDISDFNLPRKELKRKGVKTFSIDSTLHELTIYTSKKSIKNGNINIESQSLILQKDIRIQDGLLKVNPENSTVKPKLVFNIPDTYTYKPKVLLTVPFAFVLDVLTFPFQIFGAIFIVKNLQ